MVMKDEEIEKLKEIAKGLKERSKTMTKREAIEVLNRAGIVTKKGEFTSNYKGLKAFSKQESTH
jgi:hypothetical protein